VSSLSHALGSLVNVTFRKVTKNGMATCVRKLPTPEIVRLKML
jgi:hypothetical protein